MAHYHDDGTEADYMDECQMVQLGAGVGERTTEYEVVNGRNKRMFAGARSECWAFRMRNGGFVRKAEDDETDMDEWSV